MPVNYLGNKNLEEQIKKIDPMIPDGVFQFKLTTPEEGHTFLNEHPNIPFVIRSSSMLGKDNFSLTCRDEKTEKPFKRYKIVLSPRDASYLIPFHNLDIIIQDTLPTFNLLNRDINYDVRKVVVWSTQSLDSSSSRDKVALDTDDVNKMYENDSNRIFMRYGHGHTGLAMARALQAPFIVVRSAGNRDDEKKVVKGRVGNNGLIVITGHGSAGGDVVSGGYEQPLDYYPMPADITRTPRDFVEAAIDNGLKINDKLTILLTICHGARAIDEKESSFAHKLAREFALEGISTKIIASDIRVGRFGGNAAQNGSITFNNKIGMHPEHIHVFTTNVLGKSNDPQINTYKLEKSIRLSEKGLSFHSSDQLIEDERKLAAEQAQRAGAEQRADAAEKRAAEQRADAAEKRAAEQLAAAQRAAAQLAAAQLAAEQKVTNSSIVIKAHQLIELIEEKNTEDSPLLNNEELTAANNIYNGMTIAFKTHLSENEPNITAFKKDCIACIKDNRSSLDKHEGWSEFLSNLILGLLTLGVGILIKGAVNTYYDRPFFSVRKNEVDTLLEEVHAFDLGV